MAEQVTEVTVVTPSEAKVVSAPSEAKVAPSEAKVASAPSVSEMLAALWVAPSEVKEKVWCSGGQAQEV